MATVYRLPLPSASNETIRVSLDDVTYTMRWLWNERDGIWTIDLRTQDGTDIATSLKAVIGWDLLTDVSNELRPPGRLYFFDESTSATTSIGEDPGEDDLATRVYLYYVPLDAVEELSS